MANPLKDRAKTGDEWLGGTRTRDDWIDWCWQRNQRAMDTGLQVWLFVMDINGSFKIEAAKGDDAEEIWRMVRDKPLVPYRWAAPAIHKQHGLIAWRLSRGMAPDAYMMWSAAERRERRKAYVEQEIRLAGGSRRDGQMVFE